MRKILLLLMLFLFCPTILLAQNNNDETILDELIINSKTKKKLKKYKLSGRPAYNSMDQDEFIVTGVTNLPKGKISNVTFYFNTSFVDFVDYVSGEKFNTNYIDVKLGLLIYEMKDNKEIGEIVSDCELTFMVPHNHKGAYKIDLSKIDIPDDKFFIGFKVLSKTNKGENNIYIRLFENDEYLSFSEIYVKDFSNPEKDTKMIISNFAHLKMTLEILQ